MDSHDLAKLADKIDTLVSEARTSSDKGRRTKCIEEALALSCKMISQLNRRLDSFTARVLQECDLNEQDATISFKDVVAGREDLTELQSKEAVLDFLGACEPMLVSQLFLSKEKIRTLLHEVTASYEQFMDQRVSAANFREQFARLERFFCRPPYNGGGGPLLDGGPKSGPSSGREHAIWGYVETFAAVGSFLIEVIKFFGGASARAPDLGAPMRPDPERKLALVSLLLLTGYSRSLGEQEEVPDEVYTPLIDRPVSAGGGMSAGETAGAGA